ncbi:PDZK1-interacting protein 1 [Discoglossus pictus]
MFSLGLVLCTLLIALGQGSAQQGHSREDRLFPQWLTGIIAVTVFLFLVLVVYAANRYWDHRSQANSLSIIEDKVVDMEEVVSNGTHERYIKTDDFRSQEHAHAYENPVEVTDNVLTTPM